MPYLYFTRQSGHRIESFFWEVPEDDVAAGTSITQGESSSTAVSDDDRQTSPLATFKSNYANLPDYLKRCLDYFCIVTRRASIDEKGKLIRLLLAECLVPEKAGEIMEDLAEEIIGELIHLGMLTEYFHPDFFKVPYEYEELCLFEVDEQYFVSEAPNFPVRAVIKDDGNNTLPSFTNLQVRSLFVTTAERRGLHSSSASPTRDLSQAYMQTICSLQSLLVLNIDGRIEYLPDEVGDLVQLRYLALSNSKLNELPKTLGNLQKLQTLDIRLMSRNLRELPLEVLTIQNLRHLVMSRCINNGEVRVPKEIGKLTNLHSCHGVYAGGGIASELSRLTQLRELSVKRVSEDHASELYAAIMKMENLLSVKLEAETNCYSIGKRFLEHWIEIVNGAFPSLKSLTLRCTRLRFLPEGLQNISTLEELWLSTVHGDLARRLKSTENYKIKHILKLRAYFEGGKFIYEGSPEEVLQHA
uniref:Disease resistance R13L4/SHOC-2-like LRR domain-containing protein n=1 Tax=Manihot esculenta TaxID=3983 RepID=A0A2C9UT44_MANES